MGEQLAQYIIGILVAWLVGVGIALLHRLIPVIDLKKAESLAAGAEREIVAKSGVAYDAVRLAEDVYASLDGPAKLQKALTWAVAKFAKLGLTVTPTEIEELVRIAYQDFAGAVGQALTPPTPPPTTIK